MLARDGVPGRSRWVALGVTSALVLGAGGVLTSSASGSPGASSFVPVTPCRLMDTRRAPDNVGSRATPLGAGDTYAASVWGTNGNCTIPATATAVSMNIAIVNPTAASFLTTFPSDKIRPLAASLNWVAGQAPTPNAVTSPLSADGKVSFYNLSGTVDLAVDVVGFYEPSTSGPAGPAGPAGPLSSRCGATLRWDLPACTPAAFATGTTPRAVAFDGSSIWVANYASNTVSKINPATGARVDFPTGTQPQGVAFDGTNIWVTNSGAATVSKMIP